MRKTALNTLHRQMGGRMISFAGFEMPVQYEGPLPEHLGVRTRAGIFDVSHMGELEVKGSNAQESMQKLTCNDIRLLAVSQCQYSVLTTPKGAFIDDIVIYRMAQDHFFICVNAANQEKDFLWIRENAYSNTEVNFRSDDFSQISVQGPRAMEILRPLTDIHLAEMKYYWFARGAFAGVEAIVSRTGYTGEDGYEIYCDPSKAESVWTQIMESGKPFGLVAAGLAARNTLRLEAKMLLYGNDMDETTSVLEAGLGRICKIDKGNFIGREDLLRQSESGIKRILAGFEMIDRGIARDHYPVEFNGERISAVTSGSPAPFLKKNIGLAYLPVSCSKVGMQLDIIIREKPAKAQVVTTPFYRRAPSN
ncbi:MAG: glycine cleavage system aminomethyltransferase GcvT [Acidobacteria bacterium]|nr:glycine cleavage system aminomethyltransferase GcvT [Acidobacteriota bacterium]